MDKKIKNLEITANVATIGAICGTGCFGTGIFQLVTNKPVLGGVLVGVGLVVVAGEALIHNISLRKISKIREEQEKVSTLDDEIIEKTDEPLLLDPPASIDGSNGLVLVKKK